MKKLYAPWRSQYIIDKENIKKEQESSHHCVFCKKFAENDDAENFILKRFECTAVILNIYPYNSGHLLILPLAHHAELQKLSDRERNEHFTVVNKATSILEQKLTPHGFNIGLNLGHRAGAGIPEHLHTHIVPRWEGDTNFMPVIAQTKAISFDLNKTFNVLKPLFDEL